MRIVEGWYSRCAVWSKRDPIVEGLPWVSISSYPSSLMCYKFYYISLTHPDFGFSLLSWRVYGQFHIHNPIFSSYQYLKLLQIQDILIILYSSPSPDPSFPSSCDLFSHREAMAWTWWEERESSYNIFFQLYSYLDASFLEISFCCVSQICSSVLTDFQFCYLSPLSLQSQWW